MEPLNSESSSGRGELVYPFFLNKITDNEVTNMDRITQPRVLKGFRDFLPSEEIVRKTIIQKLEHTFELFGFVPIDTPILEYAEVLLGKGGGETDKQVYRFSDHGDRDVAMRFDLTVPFARYMAAHSSELYQPFRRYHVAKVWRGESPQRGRYREFMQCDFDIVGADDASSDFDIMQVIQNSIQNLGIDRFTVHFSHRGIFNAFLQKLGLQDQSIPILRIVDKLGKAGEEQTKQSLCDLIG
jgi:histidyl-tRNA synthetase